MSPYIGGLDDPHRVQSAGLSFGGNDVVHQYFEADPTRVKFNILQNFPLNGSRVINVYFSALMPRATAGANTTDLYTCSISIRYRT